MSHNPSRRNKDGSSTTRRDATSDATTRDAMMAAGNATLVPSSSRVLLAVSGGADSMALLGWMLAIHGVRQGAKSNAGANVVVAHVNHGLRGTQSDGDEAFVRAHCEKFGVPFVGERLHLLRPDENAGSDFSEQGDSNAVGDEHVSEEKARRARYGCLVRMARARNCSVVATGHTMSDSLESTLLFLLRGATISGWRGIREQRVLARGISLVRPLLGVSRQETRRWCRDLDWPWREDASNADARYKRNRVRRELVPLMCDLAQRGEATLARQAARAAGILADDLDCLDALAKTHLETLTVRRESHLLALDGLGFRALPVALQRRVLREAAQQVQAQDHHFQDAATEASIELSSSEEAEPSETLVAQGALGGVVSDAADSKDRAVINASGGQPLAVDATRDGAGNEWESGAAIEITAQHIEQARLHIASNGRRAVWSWRGGLRVEWTGAMAGNRIRVWLVENKAFEASS